MPAAYLKAEYVAVSLSWCQKKAFDSRKMAMKALRSIGSPPNTVAVGEGDFMAYRCKFCAGWHLGHRR